MSQLLRQLVIDVGNSRIKFVLLKTVLPLGASHQLPLVEHALSILVEDPLPWDQIADWLKPTDTRCLSSVAGSNPHGIKRVLNDWPESILPDPLEVLNTDDFPLEITVDEPRKVGIDRLFNAVAANRLKSTSQAAIIVDTGTATTVDVVSTEGCFAGGAILPGFELSAKSLHDYTALLPLIPVEDLRQIEPVVLGKNTTDAIRSGLFWGQLGAVRELITQHTKQILVESTSGEAPLVLLTGGGSALLAPHLDESVHFEPLLSLQGLALVAQQIRGIQ
ncbi:type III pantothenate kinase [Gimesia benthica]|uniref:Type III pantothenate kinase n=1 Tax=Gimesia benthica TaxID=2608982 RepID=A0A6I6AEN1_9PLAN|nr:acetate and sugar kinases/Hsc70/actin family protein [Gimesia benthica]QGQ23349.1 type III pantothenate kinase [Gimesia benthica]